MGSATCLISSWIHAHTYTQTHTRSVMVILASNYLGDYIFCGLIHCLLSLQISVSLSCGKTPSTSRTKEVRNHLCVHVEKFTDGLLMFYVCRFLLMIFLSGRLYVALHCNERADSKHVELARKLCELLGVSVGFLLTMGQKLTFSSLA